MQQPFLRGTVKHCPPDEWGFEMELGKGCRISQQPTSPPRQYTYQSMCYDVEKQLLATNSIVVRILLCFWGSQYKIIPAKIGKPVQLVLMQI